MQLNIDSSDAVMMGTEHSSEDTGYVTTRYQLRLINSSIMIDAYLNCKDPSFILQANYNCSQILYEDYY
jgi:hypothetical protein